MDFDSLFRWILKNRASYPGKHLESQPRTLPEYKPLEPLAQFHVVIEAFSNYIKEALQNGKGVMVKNLGAFTFEIISETIKPAQFYAFDTTKNLESNREDRKHTHKIRPCFVVDANFKYSLSNFAEKEEVTSAKSQHSLYQKGFAMIFCNPVPIAAACYLSKDVVSDSINAVVKAINDLTKLGHNLKLNLGFLILQVTNKSFSFKYSSSFEAQLNTSSFEHRLKKSEVATKTHWTTAYNKKWEDSKLSTMLKKPNSTIVQDSYEKTLALKIMSLDFNTTEHTYYSDKKKASNNQ